ncbi:MAG TPA: hypothetical protein PLL98_04785 [Bacillota bacterium]|nr:hypothetical protein [Bacillota bacterium]
MKKALGIAAVFIIVIVIIIGIEKFEAQAADDIKIDIRVGFDKFYKIGCSTPVHFEIENKLRDINGELQIEIPNQSDSIVIYAMNVSLPRDSTKKFIMNVPMNIFNTKLKVNIAEGKNIISTKTFRVDPGSNMETYVIGILSDDFDSVKYINRVTIANSGNFGTQNVRLDENSFPEDIDVLKTFNVIVINNFDTSKLGRLQYETLKKWVINGGVLIIGTGPSQNKTLAVFKDDFITGEIGEVRIIKTSSLHEMVQSIETFNIGVLDISIKNSLPIIKEGDFILLQKNEKGKGVIGVASFDFGMEPLSTWIGNSAFADKIIASLMPAYYPDMYQKGMMYRENLYAIDNALRNIPELPMPKTPYIIFIYAAYILLTAPISYIVLKRLDKRELMWLTVPALSIIFSGAVYVSGAGTRLTEPVINVISVIDIDNSGVIASKTYAGVFTPNKDSIRIEAAGDFDISPLRINEGYYMGSMADENTPKRIESKVIVSPKTILEFYKSGVWSMKTLAVETDDFLTGKLESSLNYSKGSLVGTIKNTSGFDLDECYIITPNQYADAGPIKNGETKQIDIKPSSYFGQRYELINAIYKDPYTGPRAPNQNNKLTAEEMAKMRRNNQKRQVLEYSLMNEAYEGFEAKLIAWSSTPISKDLLINGRNTKKYEKSLITSKVNLSFRDGNNVEYPFGFIKPAIVNSSNEGKFDDYSSMFFGRGSFEIHFQIDSSIKLESIKTQFTVGDIQRVKQYIWDNEKKAWVPGDYRSFDINTGLIEKYVDSNNVLKLKIEIEDDNVQLPQIAVKGSVK